MMTKQQIINVLRDNVEIYHRDPHFVAYFVELTLYLLENQYEKSSGSDKNLSIHAATTRGGDAAMLSRAEKKSSLVHRKLNTVAPSQSIKEGKVVV